MTAKGKKQINIQNCGFKGTSYTAQDNEPLVYTANVSWNKDWKVKSMEGFKEFIRGVIVGMMVIGIVVGMYMVLWKIAF